MTEATGGHTNSELTMLRPTKTRNGRVRSHFDFTPEVRDMLRLIAHADRRTMLDELSHLVMERARALNLAGQLSNQVGDG